jgi:hypothetical protein
LIQLETAPCGRAKALYLDAAPVHLNAVREEIIGRCLVEVASPLLKIMGKFGIVREFWSFLRVRKKWWITPIVIFLVALGALLVFAKGSALAPFIYSLF